MGYVEEYDDKKRPQPGGHVEVSHADLFTGAFMKARTQFENLQQMIDAYPGSLEGEGDSISEGWEAFIRENSEFESWGEMCAAAFAAYLAGS